MLGPFSVTARGRAWDAGEADPATEALRAALELAHELRYF